MRGAVGDGWGRHRRASARASRRAWGRSCPRHPNRQRAPRASGSPGCHGMPSVGGPGGSPCRRARSPARTGRSRRGQSSGADELRKRNFLTRGRPGTVARTAATDGAHHHAGATEARRPWMRPPFRPYRKQNIGRGRAGRRAVEEGAPWVSPRHRPPPASVGQSVAWCGSAGGHGDQRVSGSGVATRTTRAARASSAAAIAADVASQSGARARSTALGRVASVNEPP